MNFIKRRLAWLTDQILCLFISFLTGVRPKSEREIPSMPTHATVYYANHASHGDFLLIWVSLPRRWRKHVRPVAGADYWLSNPIKRFVITYVFNGLLIARDGTNPQASTEKMQAALMRRQSIIIFPEGTRNTDENCTLQPFKSGIYHLANQVPQTNFVPMWIENINHVLPKGKVLPVPLLCQVHIGEPLTIRPYEGKEEFIARCHAALLALAPQHKENA